MFPINFKFNCRRGFPTYDFAALRVDCISIEKWTSTNFTEASRKSIKASKQSDTMPVILVECPVQMACMCSIDMNNQADDYWDTFMATLTNKIEIEKHRAKLQIII